MEIYKKGDKVAADYKKEHFNGKETDFEKIKTITTQGEKAVHGKLSKMPGAWIDEYCADGLKTSDDANICAILGLSDDVSTWLSELDPRMRTHQGVLYFIKKSVDVTAERGADDTTCGKPNLFKTLQSLRFTQDTAAKICRNIPDGIVDLQTPAYWAKRYLDHAYSYHPLLKTCRRYPYSADNVDKWFVNDLAQGSGEDKQHGKIYMINLSDPKEHNKVTDEFLTKLREPEDGYQLLFHGTTHDSAVSLITDGIILTRGQQKQDFSSGDGFYVSEDFANARLWCRAGRGGYQAVVVYKIQRSLLDIQEQNGLDLTQDRSLWKKVVCYCRNGYKDKRTKKALSRFYFIRGSLCRNPQNLSREGECPSGFGRSDIQLCIRNED